MHLGRFRTWGVFALGAFSHLGRFYTWGVFALGAFLHLGRFYTQLFPTDMLRRNLNS